MADYATRYTVATTSAFKVKVGIAAVIVATQVISESTGNVERDRRRVTLARYVLENPTTVADRFALILAAQDVPASETDESVTNLVLGLWDAIAGVSAEDVA